jgi:hypothetical protein
MKKVNSSEFEHIRGLACWYAQWWTWDARMTFYDQSDCPEGHILICISSGNLSLGAVF